MRDMLKALRRRYPGLFAVKTLVLWIPALWKPIEFVLNWIGLVDTVRAAMDPQHWFSQVLFWPPLGLVISLVGIAGLFFVIWRDRRHWTAERTFGAPKPAVSALRPDLAKRLADLEQEGVRSLLPAEIGKGVWEHPETFTRTVNLWRRHLLIALREAGATPSTLSRFETLAIDPAKEVIREGLSCIDNLCGRGQQEVTTQKPLVEPAGITIQPQRRLRPSEYMGIRKPWESDIHRTFRSTVGQAFQDVNRMLHESDRLERERLPAKTVSLDWRQTDRGLHLSAVNRTANVIRDFQVFLCDLKRYSESTGVFVEVPAFHSSGPFRELELSDDAEIYGGALLFHETPVVFRFVNTEPSTLFFKGRNKEASIEERLVREAGVWSATFRLQTCSKQRIEDLLFQWKPGDAPTPFSFPPSTGGGAGLGRSRF